MTEIYYKPDFPVLIQPKVAEILENFRWLLPAWLQILTIHFDGDNQNTAFITVNKDYRFANLTICGNWVGETEFCQNDTIIHEFLHLHFSPVKNYALDTLDILSEDETVKRLIKNELISRNEAATQDLAWIINKKFNA